MSTARTKISNWIYRAVLVLMVAGTIRYATGIYDVMSDSFVGRSGTVYWTALITTFSGPASFFVATVAFFLRSGAVVWLLGLQFGFTAATLAPTMLIDPGTMFVPLLFAAVVILITALFALTFAYLIRREEIRSP